jgi:hypothetical protein
MKCYYYLQRTTERKNERESPIRGGIQALSHGVKCLDMPAKAAVATIML